MQIINSCAIIYAVNRLTTCLIEALHNFFHWRENS